MPEENVSRRSFLEYSTAAAVVGGLAGCETNIGSGDGGDGGGRYGTPYREWTPADGSFYENSFTPRIKYLSYDSVRKYGDELAVEPSSITGDGGLFGSLDGVEASNVNATVSINDETIWTGTFEAETVAESLRNLNVRFNDADNYEDYHGVEAIRGYYFVSSNALIKARTRDRAITLIDTKLGQHDQAFEATDSLEQVVSETGSGTAVGIRKGPDIPSYEDLLPPETTTWCDRFTIRGESTAFHFVFDTSTAVEDGFAANAAEKIADRYVVESVEGTQSASRVAYTGEFETSRFVSAYQNIGQFSTILPLPTE